MKYRTFIAAFMSLALLNSCDTKLFDQRIHEGVIEYDVTYPYMSEDNVLKDFMPETMTMRFHDDRYVTDLSAGMGMFKTNFIVDSENYTLHHCVKLINKLYATTLDTNAIQKFNEKKPQPHIIHLNETEVVAGYTCKKALIMFDRVREKSFYILYTNEIRLEDPNWTNLYGAIDGVMMEYEIKEYDIVMHFRAHSVLEADVENEEFKLNPEYEMISNEEMEQQMNEIFKTFAY